MPGFWRAARILAAATLASACGEESAPPGNPTDAGVTDAPGDGSDRGACASDELVVGETDECFRPGVPADGCGAGFVTDDAGGCTAVLPATPCAEQELAVPGETECHEVAPCGEGDWGDVVVDAATIYVNGSYAGGGSDGTKDKPWTTLAEAIAAAEAGGQIVVAAGTYAGALIEGKPVRLWGRCPALVEIVGASDMLGALELREGADGSEVHRVGLSGPQRGLAASGSQRVLVDELWIHDCVRGIDVEDALGPTEFTVKRTLVEKTRETGVLVLGADLTLEDSVVRGTRPYAGFQVSGIGAEENLVNKHGATLTVRRSLVEQNVGFGVLVAGGTVTIESTLVQGTQPTPKGEQGIGIAIQSAPVAPSSATLRQVVVAENRTVGVYVAGATAILDRTVVQGTLAQQADQKLGRGVSVEPHPDTGARAHIEITRSLIVDNVETGLAAFGSDVTLEDSAIRDTQPGVFGQLGGRGMSVQDHPTAGGSSITVRSSLLAGNHDTGMFVWASEAVVESSLVLETLARVDGRFGDGILAASGASLTLTASRVTKSARAGLSNFASTVVLEGNLFACNPIDLDGESVRGEATFDDQGANVCGCDDVVACQVVSSQLEPPEALGP